MMGETPGSLRRRWVASGTAMRRAGVRLLAGLGLLGSVWQSAEAQGSTGIVAGKVTHPEGPHRKAKSFYRRVNFVGTRALI